MVYFSALIGGLFVNIGIAVMALMQGLYQGEKCKRSRYMAAASVLLAVAASTFMLLLEWMPMAGELAASIVAAVTLIALSAANGYSAYYTGVKDCPKARLYSIILITVFLAMGALTGLLTII